MVDASVLVREVVPPVPRGQAEPAGVAISERATETTATTILCRR
jgi:hypothetical protein